MVRPFTIMVISILLHWVFSFSELPAYSVHVVTKITSRDVTPDENTNRFCRLWLQLSVLYIRSIANCTLSNRSSSSSLQITLK